MHIPNPAVLLLALVVPAMGQDSKSDPSSKADSKSDAKSSSASKESKASSSASSSARSSASSSAPKSTSVASTTSAPSSSASFPPVRTGTQSFPSLSQNIPVPTFSIIVPDTQDAPFMQHSSAPEGTVFIAVGAILGAFAVAILLWRAIVSLMLHRSVERATMAQMDRDTKGTGFPAPPAPFYKYTDRQSTTSFGQDSGPQPRSTRRTNRGPTPSNLSQSNLFFSPTANTGANAASNRASGFLPSGFYAGGSSTPGAQPMGSNIGMTNLRPDAHGHYVSASRNTPPESPAMSAARGEGYASSTNLGAPLHPGQRAPSAYLEDLLADEPASFPPSRGSPALDPTRR